MGANDETGLASVIGQSVLRKEDARYLTGTGQFTADVVMPRQTYAYFLRSPHAHATIRSIDVQKAKGSPGVVGVFTGGGTLLRPGMFGRIEVVYDQRADALTVPRAALLEDAGDLALQDVGLVRREVVGEEEIALLVELAKLFLGELHRSLLKPPWKSRL